MPFDLANLESILSFLSTITVIAGAFLVVLQLRLNTKLVKSRTAFDLIGKVVDASFPARRHRLYEVSAKYAGGDWTGFDRSLDDFEVRNFASIYEQIGILVKKGVIDIQDAMDALSAQPMADWITFEPIRSHIAEGAGRAFPGLPSDPAAIDAIYWPNFKWLAAQNEKWIRSRVPAAGND